MLEYYQSLALKYDVSLENVLAIALNRYGIKYAKTSDNRIRFNLKMLNSSQTYYFAVCVNTYPNSPFTLENDNLYLEDTLVGQVQNIEKDTCTSTYFRNNYQAITFNSNSRSKCAGCKFCGTYSLTEDDNYDFQKKDNVQEYFENLLKENNIASLGKIKDITICTGCFLNEDELINHLLMLNESFQEMRFTGNLNYIGSQLTTYAKIKDLTQNIPNFGLFLTIEKFLEREKFMRPEKAKLTLEKAKCLLEYAKSLNVTATFLYILGLENLEVVAKYFNYFKDSINKFPIVQVFQDYTLEQEAYRVKEAKDIEYYLKAKAMLNAIFESSNLRPKDWENFRSLYVADKKVRKI